MHCHDWQTGLVPVLLHEQYREVMPDQRVCYTVHNFRHRGTSDGQVLWATGLAGPVFDSRLWRHPVPGASCLVLDQL